MTGGEMAHDRMRKTSGRGEMQPGDHRELTRKTCEKWLWTNFTVILLGSWLVSSPFTFGYTDAAMRCSEVASGLLLAFFAELALWPCFDFIGRWSVALVGVWLQSAPLVFWVPDPAAYVNDTLMIALAFIGWLISRYLAAFQLGYIRTVWEPFFGESTVRVLTSEVSRSMPISDAG